MRDTQNRLPIGADFRVLGTVGHMLAQNKKSNTANPKKPSPRSNIDGKKRQKTVLAGLLVVLFMLVFFHPTTTRPVAGEPLSVMIKAIEKGQVGSISVDDSTQEVTAYYKNGKAFQSAYPLGYGAKLVENFATLTKVKVATPHGVNVLEKLVLTMIPMLTIIGAMFYFLRGGGISKIPGISAIKANPDIVPATRFLDVGGVDEVVEELVEVVDYLHNPEKYRALGAKVPHGILLVGPPGTGKTLLAKAVAGEAGVPFYAISGSDFVDTFVGVGARRVREIFKEARKAKKAIIFIDELDAVGRVRGGGPANGATEESDRTLNALLVEMDGYVDSSVIVLAATNRPEVLDAALLRSGRFERKITIGVPDKRGREQILRLLCRELTTTSVDLRDISGRTSGLTGADLAFLVNEAAMQGARRGGESITQEDFLASLEVLMLGRARTSAIISDEERELTAWHEAGHAVVSLVLEAADDPVRVSIIPRGPAGGVTWMDSEDRHFISRKHALAQLQVLMAGRAGEILLSEDNYTSGIAADLRVAGKLATSMVKEWAMSELGPRWSESVNRSDDSVSKEVDHLLSDALEGAKMVLVEHRELFSAVVGALLENDTIDRDGLDRLKALVEQNEEIPAGASTVLP